VSATFLQKDYVTEAIRCLTELLQSTPLTPVPIGIGLALDNFARAASGRENCRTLISQAQSLSQLLAEHEEELLDGESHQQVMTLSQDLLQGINQAAGGPATPANQPLVAPIPPSGPRQNRSVALLIANQPVAIMLEQTLSDAGFPLRQLDALGELAFFDAENCPAALITDLDLCNLDAASAQMFSDLRERFSPPIHLFCLADITDIPARLQAVRLGATRFFGKQPDIQRLIAVLRGVTKPVQPYRVLLVDDDPFVCAVHQQALNRAGIATLVVSDPLQAPEAIEEFNPDVIVSDIYMPGCNGLELLVLLRQDEQLANTPIVFLTCEQDDQRRLEALELGADGFLQKPVSPETLLATVRARAKRARVLKRVETEHQLMIEQLRKLQANSRDGIEWPEAGDIRLEEIFSEEKPLQPFSGN